MTEKKRSKNLSEEELNSIKAKIAATNEKIKETRIKLRETIQQYPAELLDFLANIAKHAVMLFEDLRNSRKIETVLTNTERYNDIDLDDANYLNDFGYQLLDIQPIKKDVFVQFGTIYTKGKKTLIACEKEEEKSIEEDENFIEEEERSEEEKSESSIIEKRLIKEKNKSFAEKEEERSSEKGKEDFGFYKQ